METKTIREGLILLIMYDRLQVAAFNEKLRGYGYDHIEVCTDGKAALEKLNKIEPAVIISDTELKGELNGIETGKRIKDQYDLPLIYMSKLQDENTFQKARDTKPLAFLSKPVNWNELRMAIESARVRNEEKASLNTKLEKYSQWFEKAPVSYLILDEGGNINAVNKTWTELTGYSSDEITGKWFGDFIPAGSHQAFNQCIANLVKKGSIHDLEFQLIKKDGQKITIAFEGKVNYGPRGEVISVQCIITDITETQRIKFKLEESEERFRLLFEEAPLGYQSLSKDGGLIYVNKTWCEMLGYYKKEVIGKWFGDFLTPEDKERFQTNFSAFKQKGSAHDIQYKMIKKDGSIIYVSIDSKVRNDEKGNYIQSHCIIKDITAQKLAEDKLHESEKKFRNLLESAGDIIYVLDNDLQYLYGNNLCLERYGVTKEELIGKNYSDFHSVESSDKFNEKVRIVQKSGKPILYEHQSSIDGRYFLRTLSPIIESEKKKIESITVISRDITGLKKIEQALRKRENEISTITDNIPALISYVDANGHYRFINRQYEKWFGIPYDKIIGKHYKEILGENVYNQIKDHVDKALSGKRITHDDELNFAKGGTRWVNGEYIPDLDDNGVVSGFFALVRDITERKRAEVQLRASEERYRGLANSITDVFFAMDKDLKYTFWNKASEKLTGIAEKNAIGKSFNEIFPDTQQTKIAKDVYLDVLRKRKARTFITEFTLAGKDFVFEISAYPARDGISVFVKDITERKKIESELYESRQMLQIVLDTIPAGVFWKGHDLCYRGGNRTFLNTYGLKSSEEVVGMTDYDFPWDKDLANSFRDQDKRIMESGIPEYDIIESVTLVDGTQSWARTNKVPMQDKEGNIIGILGIYEDITDRRKAEKNLQESEERYRTIFENGPVGMVLTDRNFRFLSANPKFCNMIGYTVEELKGMTFLDITHPDHIEADRKNVENMLAGKISSYRTEKRYIARNGDIHWGNLITTVIRVQDGKFLYALAMIEDITERKQAEEKFQRILERLDLATSAAHIGIWDWDIQKNHLIWDEEMYRLYGIRKEDFSGAYEAWLNGLHPDDREQSDEFSKLARSGKGDCQTEFRIIWPDGSVRYLEAHGQVIKDKNGEPMRMIGINIDITEKKKAEKELVESKQLLQIVLDTIPAAVFWKDRDLFYLGANRTFMNATGLNAVEEIIGKSDLNLSWEKDQAKSFREYDRKVIESGISEFDIVEPFTRADGVHSWARTNKVPLHDVEGNIIGVLGTYEDITERKQAEEALQMERKRLHDVLEVMPMMVCLLTPDYHVKFANRAFREKFGESHGRHCYEYCFGKNEPCDFCESYRVLKTGKPHRWQVTSPKGDTIIDAYDFPFTDADGSKLILEVDIDITEQKMAEQTLQTSQSRLANAMEIARLGYWEYDVAKDIFTFDDHFYSIFHTSAEKVGSYTLSSARYTELFVHPEDMDVVGTETRKAIETTDPNYSRQLEHRMIFADGQTGYILVRFYIVKDDKGRTIKTYGANQDITDRKKVEKALEESEAMLRSILRTVSVGIGVVKNRVFEWTNETYQKIIGFSESELKGKSTRMVYPDDEEFKRAGRMYNLMKKHGVGSIEVKHKHKSGKIIDVLINIAPIIPGDLNSGVAFILLDITERKKAEKEILEKSEDLSLLVKINTLVNSGADIDSITGELSSEIKRIFDCDGAAVMLMDIKGESLVIRDIPFTKAKITDIERLIGQKLTGSKIKVSTDFIHQLLLEREKVLLINSPDEIRRLVRDYAENPLLQRIPDIIKLLGINSVIIIPLVSNNKPVGIIVISSRKIFKQDILERIANLSENLANIVARKQAESALHASETRFRAFMEHLPVMTYMKDKEGKFIYGNKATLKLADRTSATYTGSIIDEFLPGDLAKWMKQMDKKVLITNKTADLGEWKWIKKNREQWFKEFKFPIHLPDGKTLIGGWMMDVTTKKAAESALIESEVRYKDLIEKAGLAIMTDDNEGKITYFNHEFAKLFGYSMAGIKKQTRETLIHSKDLNKIIGYHNKRMKGGLAPDRYEIRGIQKNGNEIWMEVTTTVLSKQDKIIGTRNYIWDITEQKKTRQELENSMTRFRELFSSMSSGVAIYEYLPNFDQFVFREMNEAGFRIIQITDKEKIVGRNISEVLPGVKSMGLIDVMRKVVKSGKPGKLSASYYKDDRIELYIDNYVYKLPTGEIVSVFDDITERIVAEQVVWRNYEEIRKLSQHLETIREEERKQISSELHDELGQILTAIKMDVSWIRNKMPPERKGIKKRAGSTIQIINEAIRSVQRLSIELRPRMLDDLGLLETLKAFFKEYESWANIPVRYDLAEKEPDLIPGQEISVFRIIQESLTNIARHAGATEVKLIIKERNDNLDLKIQDNGIGIPDEKVHSSDSFGILNMRERIQRWGGKFEVKGKKGAGTTISASIPIGKVKT